MMLLYLVIVFSTHLSSAGRRGRWGLDLGLDFAANSGCGWGWDVAPHIHANVCLHVLPFSAYY